MIVCGIVVVASPDLIPGFTKEERQALAIVSIATGIITALLHAIFLIVTVWCRRAMQQEAQTLRL